MSEEELDQSLAHIKASETGITFTDARKKLPLYATNKVLSSFEKLASYDNNNPKLEGEQYDFDEYIKNDETDIRKRLLSLPLFCTGVALHNHDNSQKEKLGEIKTYVDMGIKNSLDPDLCSSISSRVVDKCMTDSDANVVALSIAAISRTALQLADEEEGRLHGLIDEYIQIRLDQLNKKQRIVAHLEAYNEIELCRQEGQKKELQVQRCELIELQK